MIASELNNTMKIKLNGKGHFLTISRVWHEGATVYVNTKKGTTVFDQNDHVVSNTPSTRMVERTNIMTGKKFMELADTPRCCSPSSEAYWSM